MFFVEDLPSWLQIWSMSDILLNNRADSDCSKVVSGGSVSYFQVRSLRTWRNQGEPCGKKEAFEPFNILNGMRGLFF